MSMICSRCRQIGIQWVGPWGALTHTECLHCGGINCQEPDDPCSECGYPGCNGECAGDDMMGSSS